MSHLRPNLLFAWVGMADLKGPREDPEDGLGPIAQAVEKLVFDEIHLLANLPEEGVRVYAAWLRGKTRAKVVIHDTPLTGPTKFGEIYEQAAGVLDKVTT